MKGIHKLSKVVMTMAKIEVSRGNLTEDCLEEIFLNLIALRDKAESTGIISNTEIINTLKDIDLEPRLIFEIQDRLIYDLKQLNKRLCRKLGQPVCIEVIVHPVDDNLVQINTCREIDNDLPEIIEDSTDILEILENLPDLSEISEEQFEFTYEPSYHKNNYILSWWTEKHDQLIIGKIHSLQWYWLNEIVDDIVALTGQRLINEWKEKDPFCSRRAWYNILRWFAEDRATVLGYNKLVRKPDKKTCPICFNIFDESSLPYSLAIRLGMDNLDFCLQCTSIIHRDNGRNDMSKIDILDYLKELSIIIGKTPPQSFGNDKKGISHLNKEQQLKVLKLMSSKKPKIDRVKELFGTWRLALIEAEVL